MEGEARNRAGYCWPGIPERGCLAPSARKHLPHLDAPAGVMFGFDVNGSYRPYNRVDPLLGAVSIRFTGAGFENDIFNRLGIAIKVIPPAPKGGSTAINFALSYKLD